jgi:hypothetical protein
MFDTINKVPGADLLAVRVDSAVDQEHEQDGSYDQGQFDNTSEELNPAEDFDWTGVDDHQNDRGQDVDKHLENLVDAPIIGQFRGGDDEGAEGDTVRIPKSD